ncbi:MAG: hypothetical protein LUG88_04450 [Clostridia bacterium]|nr:hypothetical protein [Clostridia bacterium]
MAASLAGDREAAEKLDQSRSAQTDPFEGTMGTIDLGKATIEDAQLGKLLADSRLRAKGYDYSNVMCFCKMNYTATPCVGNYNLLSLDWEKPDMHEFGKYGVIITDQQEFLRRINKGFEENKCKYIAGSVAYHRLSFRGRELKEAMRISHLLYPDLVGLDKANANAPEHDAFDK